MTFTPYQEDPKLSTRIWSSQPVGKSSQLWGSGGMPPRGKILAIKAQIWWPLAHYSIIYTDLNYCIF
uniref:Uncharacterized protein n=1 Tax=Anguilla anguilla TaxID=7936 RepID=A0A0E9WMK3_ANGAN